MIIRLFYIGTFNKKEGSNWTVWGHTYSGVQWRSQDYEMGGVYK